MQRKVALKIVKPGAATKEVITRFAAERQALAMMDHTNIAHVFDAGVTDDGRPYFVMELVRGAPITDFCRHQQLRLREKLLLFQDVCDAVHHAHQKGIIHRDLKPSNVLVTLHGQRRVAKVIDFGVAKALNQDLTDQTIYTRLFSIMGTPLYMSPEQAALSGLDVDTRSDIYSLGVLLYELITGTTPFDPNRIQAASFDEMRRILLEELPPRPSVRLTTLRADKTTTATERSPAYHQESGAKIAGDLDWIVMKAMEKDRSRRYDSSASLSADIGRFLRGEPIEARPPSRSYLWRKFAARHRVWLVTAALVTLAMVTATAVSLWQTRRAFRERLEKEKALQAAVAAKQEVEQFSERLKVANSLLSSGQTHASAERWAAAYQDYTQAIQLQPNYYLPWIYRGQLYVNVNLWEESAADFSEALSLGGATDSPEWNGVPQLFLLTGKVDSYRSLSHQLISQIHTQPAWVALRGVLIGMDPADTSSSAQQLAELAEEWLAQSDNPFPINMGERRTRRDRPFGNGPPDEFPRQPPRRRQGGPPRRPAAEFGPPVRPQPIPNAGGTGRPQNWLPQGTRLYICGLAHLRAGDWQQALVRFEQASRDRGWPGHPIADGRRLACAFSDRPVRSGS